MAVTADVRIPMRPLTVDDYERMLAAGILSESDRVELLKGQLSEGSPKGPQHAAIVQWLTAVLVRAIAPEVAAVRVQLPARFLPVSSPGPDIAIVPAGSYVQEHPARALLVIEVATTSLQLDRGAKLEIYAAAGVPEYWVVDIAARRVHVHTGPSGSSYVTHAEITDGIHQPALADAPEIDVSAMFAVLD